MEFSSINEVNREFINLFLGKSTQRHLPNEEVTSPFIAITTYNNEVIQVLLRHYNKGGAKKHTENYGYYPVIVIQPFTPVPDPKRNIWVKDWIEGGYKYATTEEEESTGSIIYFPIGLTFKYQISVITEFEHHKDAVDTWFYKNFDITKTEACFLMNQTETEEDGNLGVAVPYKVEVTNLGIRDDRRYETIYDFTLDPFIHLKDSVDNIQLVEEVVTTLTLKLK